MMHVTVTGAGGFIGQHLCRFLEQSPSPGYTVQPWSVRWPLEEIEEGPTGDTLVHCAGIAHSSAADENAVLQSNTELPVRLAKWARSVGYGRFVFFSSVLVWGDHQEEINAQNDLPQPSSLYGRAKIEAEEQLLKLETPSFRVTVLRLPLVYGPGVRGNLARLIDFVNAWPIFPIGSRTALRSLCSIETVCRFVNHILINSLDGVFTITDIELSTYDIARYLAGGLEKPRLVVPTPVVVQQLLRLVAPNTGRKLYGTKVIYGGGTAQVGFNHHLNHEQVKSAFTEMVRHHLGIEKNSSCEGSA